MPVDDIPKSVRAQTSDSRLDSPPLTSMQFSISASELNAKCGRRLRTSECLMINEMSKAPILANEANSAAAKAPVRSERSTLRQ
ncbi:hypothetical protein D3C86_1809340 [compost metagenome]